MKIYITVFVMCLCQAQQGWAEQDYMTHNTVILYRITHPSDDKVRASKHESQLDSTQDSEAQDMKQVYSEMVIQMAPEEEPTSILSEDQLKERLMET